MEGVLTIQLQRGNQDVQGGDTESERDAGRIEDMVCYAL